MSVEQGFDNWLVKKLESLDIDDEILGSYISSVVTSDDSYSEKKDTLKDIMLGVTHDLDIDLLCCEVLDKWSEYLTSDSSKEQEEKTDVAYKVALIMEKQAQPVLKVINRSSEEEKLREAILSRCTYVSSEEEEENSDNGAVSTTSQNQNVEAIVQAEKERRDKLKSEAEKKKAQDKINREKQKQKQDERREKERKRTQKREHKR